MSFAGTQARPRIFGILNVTPDSFSDGGNFFSVENAVAHAKALIAGGADVVDVGGESTRPGARPIPPEEELRRVIPVIRELAACATGKISIDTVKSEVARAALDAGAEIVNDVSGMRLDPEMAPLCAKRGCEVVLMHSRGGIAEMASYDVAAYGDDPVGEIISELMARVASAESAGIESSRITIDPGIGFSKRSEHSRAVLEELPRFVALGYPILIGLSRKRVVAEYAASIAGEGRDSRSISNEERDRTTVFMNVSAYVSGASAFRVHEVRANRLALDDAWNLLRSVALPSGAR